MTEFAAGELGARLGMSTYSAWALTADALDVCHRLPRLWARVQAGEVRVYLARLVAKKTRHLTEEQAAWQFARPTRRDPETDHGMWGFYIKAPARTVLVFDAALRRIADILQDLGDTDDVEKRRVKALLVLSRPDLAAELLAAYRAWADRPEDPAGDPPPDPDDPEPPQDGPEGAGAVVMTRSTDGLPCERELRRTGPKPMVGWERLLPSVVVNVHTYADTDHATGPADDTTGVARVERCGAVTEAWVRDHLTAAARVTVRPVLDIEGLAPVDAYQIPERHRWPCA